MGQEVALRLANSGKRVVIVGRRREPLEATVKLAPADRVDYVVADLGSVEGVKHLVDVLGPHTKVAAIIAAAGGQGEFRHGGQSLEEIDAAWTAALRKNFYSSLLLVEALLDRINEGNGRVVLISSTSALDGRGGPYATAKAALHGYMMDLTQRLAPRSITVNVIAPGYVKQTDFFNAGGLSRYCRDGKAGCLTPPAETGRHPCRYCLLRPVAFESRSWLDHRAGDLGQRRGHHRLIQTGVGSRRETNTSCRPVAGQHGLLHRQTGRLQPPTSLNGPSRHCRAPFRPCSACTFWNRPGIRTHAGDANHVPVDAIHQRILEAQLFIGFVQLTLVHPQAGRVKSTPGHGFLSSLPLPADQPGNSWQSSPRRQPSCH
jgi:3-oxoacyl-[acyl-carrier protein] reductase